MLQQQILSAAFKIVNGAAGDAWAGVSREDCLPEMETLELRPGVRRELPTRISGTSIPSRRNGMKRLWGINLLSLLEG